MVLHHEFIEIAKKFSKKIAIIDKATGKNVSYGKALIASLILANKFKIYEEGYVGVMVPTSAGAFLACLGLLMAGKVPVMINYSTGAAENCEYAQGKIGFKTIVTSRALLEKINCRVVDGMICLEDIMKAIGTGDKLKAALKSKLPTSMIIKGMPPKTEDDDVVILFTSGSEKEPKAVQLSHHNVGANARDAVKVFKLSDQDVMLSILPVFHSFGQMVNFWLPLITGMTAVTYANPLDYKTIPKLIREEGATMIAATPIFISGYLRESKPGDFENMRIIIAGADKVPDWLRHAFMEKHNKVLLEGYGVTETSPVISANTPEENRPGSIGKPLPRIQVKILDLKTDEALPPGEEGKIVVKGDYVMTGYYDDIEETSLRIRDGWYDTGDMGIIDEDGYLWHRGRLKRFVKIGGEMVSLVRTESVLEELLPEGESCCVVDIPDTRKGARLAAAVTSKINEKELIKKMGEKLPNINIPTQFVVFDELPKMGSGKIDFRATTEMVKKRLFQSARG
ncbi:AMP-binding protein [candidate division KSB1 bacterium]|nr:AMP-binding protein [candidate division KSB1 bacterium]